MKRPLLALMLPCLLISCQRKAAGAEDLTTRVLFTVNGSYDAQADQRGKKPGNPSVRQVIWQKQPPLAAQTVTVEYDGEQRSRGWQLTLDKTTLTAADLAGKAAKNVTTSQGTGTLITSGPLARVLILPKPDALRLLSRGYAVQHEPDLLPAFDTP